MKRTILILILIIFTLLTCGCATKKKAREYNEKRGLMLLENTELGRNKHYNSAKYQKTLKKNYKKIQKKR